MSRLLLLAVVAGLAALLATPPAIAADNTFACLSPPTLTSALPGDTKFPNQDNFNCFAWQEFIALTWNSSYQTPGQPDPTATAAQYGTPASTTPLVWETFSPDGAVFKPAALAPDPFGVTSPPACPELATGRNPGTLFANSELVGVPISALSSIVQAGTNYSWVTAQNHKPTYYDVRLNQPEYTYLVTNKFYDARNQGTAAVSTTQGVLLPNGAIEIKAAWLEITDQSRWPRYRMVQLPILDTPTDSVTSVCRMAHMGLVALHIIQKTPLGQQFVWASFEHVDNQPDYGAVDSTVDYTYYNQNCDPTTDHYHCDINHQPTCTPQGGGLLCDPVAAPVQVVKIVPTPASTVALNDHVQNLIRQANPDSVFQYYRLVDSMWPNNNTVIPAGSMVSLTDGNAQPPLAQGGLLNPLIETYFQNSPNQNNGKGFLGCLSCHVAAPIAAQENPVRCTVQTGGGSNTPSRCASDYSFLFSKAQCPNPLACQTQ
jgi:hypothetical protein